MINSRSSLFGPLVQKRLTIGSYFLQSENINDIFYKAQKVRRLIVDEFNKIKKQVDILIFPATKIAPLINEKKDDSF
jgi:aspartyl-tRNA(Asn)/glutamyl-tRNA(Gln) amidotransferase subunit A